MQTKKVEVKNKILTIAKDQFLKYGYEKTSFRNIAQLTQMSHGNIRIYFQNKQCLFDEVVKPVTIFLDKILENQIKYSKLTKDELLEYTDINKSIKDNYRLFMYVKENRELFEILWFKSSASIYRKIKEKCIKQFIDSSDAFINALIANNIIQEITMTRIFKHTLASLFVTSIEEIILHNPDDEILKLYSKEISMLTHYGTFVVVGIDNQSKINTNS